MKTLPSFIMIGPGRTGTTWIYEILKEHPEVTVAHGIKETNYYNHEYKRGIDWYKNFFEKEEGKKAVGEVSNLYFYDAKVPERIKKDIPDVKLITCLRNPVERLESAYFFKQRREEIDASLTLSRAIREIPDLVNDNLYFTKLSAFLDFFDPGQIKVCFYDDLKNDPHQFAEDIYAFLEIDTSFKPSVLEQTVNPSAKVRFKFLTGLIDFAANKLRKLQLHAVLTFMKRNKIVQKLLLKGVDKKSIPHVSETEKKELLKKYIPEIEKIEQLTGKNLNHWKR